MRRNENHVLAASMPVPYKSGRFSARQVDNSEATKTRRRTRKEKFKSEGWFLSNGYCTEERHEGHQLPKEKSSKQTLGLHASFSLWHVKSEHNFRVIVVNEAGESKPCDETGVFLFYNEELAVSCVAAAVNADVVSMDSTAVNKWWSGIHAENSGVACLRKHRRSSQRCLFCAAQVIDKPGAPRNLKVTGVTEKTVALKWSEPETDGGCDITGYIVEERETARATWVKVRLSHTDVTSSD